MKKINKYTLLSIPALMLVISMGSCKKDYVNGGTKVQSLAGEWWVKIDGGSDPTGDFGPNYYNFSTYNTASNRPDSMWVDDDNNAKSFWDVKGKVGTNAANRTFSAANIANQDYTETFTITNGKILPGAAHASNTKDKTDSIYFEIQLSDDPVPGTVHKVAGYKRTGFDADDH